MISSVRLNSLITARKTTPKLSRRKCATYTPHSIPRKVALVTGGSRGIGRAICERLIQENYRVAVISKSELCEKTALELCTASGTPGIAVGVKCDVSELSSIPKTVEVVEELVGPIDILVNNAGVALDGILLRLREEDLQKTMNTNLLAPILLSREVSKSMLRRKASGSIIMMGSIIGEIGNVGQVSYAASKAGLIGVTKSLALELGKKGIRTNLIAPGFVKTDMTEDRMKGDPKSGAGEVGVPTATPEDIASTVFYLINTPSINGQVVTVNSHKSPIHHAMP